MHSVWMTWILHNIKMQKTGAKAACFAVIPARF